MGKLSLRGLACIGSGCPPAPSFTPPCPSLLKRCISNVALIPNHWHADLGRHVPFQGVGLACSGHESSGHRVDVRGGGSSCELQQRCPVLCSWVLMSVTSEDSLVLGSGQEVYGKTCPTNPSSTPPCSSAHEVLSLTVCGSGSRQASSVQLAHLRDSERASTCLPWLAGLYVSGQTRGANFINCQLLAT